MASKRHKVKIKAVLPASSGQITASKPPDGEVRFSFKYLDCKHGKFAFAERETAYFLKLIEQVKQVCALTPMQMRTTHKSALRCHDHDWTKTTEKDGFGLKGQLADAQGWQFQLTSNEHGRVHGFFIDHTFYVVWLDPEHALYA